MMKRVTVVLAAAALGLTASPSASQQTGPERFLSSIRLDNESVRVLEMHYEPGAAAPMHAHLHPRVVYFLESGLLELVSAAGDTSRVRGEAGQTVWRPAETHSVRNIGTTPVRVLETEIKRADPRR